MNPKILVAFVAGVAASGAAFYFASNRPAAPPARVVVAAAPQAPPAAPAEVPAVEAPAAPPAEPVRQAPAAERESHRPSAHHQKTPDRWRDSKRTPEPVTNVARRTEEPTPAALPPDFPRPMEATRPAEPAPAERPVEAARNDPPPAPAPPPVPAPKPRVPPPPPEPRKVTVSGGTLMVVRLAETVSSEKNQSGDNFRATLDQPLIVDGLVIAERGSHVEGRVIEAERARVKGTSRLQLELLRFTSSDGQMVGIRTDVFDKESTNSTKSDVAKVGIGAAAGAVLGSIFGGGKGAAIGAASGGAAGGGVAIAT
ncbi:MAG: hypothetical protein ABI823_20555, partial [Bryobacteraceae bacterium]